MKNIKLSLLFTGLMGISLAFAQVESTDFIPTPENSIVAFDLHDVVVKPNYTKMAGAAVYHGGFPLAKWLGALAFDYTRYAFTGTVGSAQQLLIDIKTAVRNGGTGDTIQHTLNAYNPALGAAARKVGAELYIIEGMEELINELYALGFELYIASNIGTEEVKWLAEKYPTFFAKFKGGKTVTYVDGVPSTKKPFSKYFKEFNVEFNPKGKKVYFPDDQLKNINGTDKNGIRQEGWGAEGVEHFVPILFKNTEQARADLKKHGFKLK